MTSSVDRKSTSRNMQAAAFAVPLCKDKKMLEIHVTLTLFGPWGSLGIPFPQFFRHNSQSFRANSLKFGDFS